MRHLGCVLLVVTSSCISPGETTCGDDLVCAPGTECATVHTLADEDRFYCVLRDQLDQCMGVAERAGCELRVGDDVRPATCHDGVCVLDECGNDLLDTQEICDDGNTKFGDGCSDTCRSDETCGNGTLNPLKLEGGVSVLGEVCDDAGYLAHDGCSPACALETPRWTEVRYGGPVGRSGHAMAWDATRGYILSFAGRINGTKWAAETWDWDGSGWAPHPMDLEPDGRIDSAIAHDSARGTMLMFGGLSAGLIPLGDTWSWDGREWRMRVPPGPQPPGRSRHALAYDSVRKKVVMFGGTGAMGALADTWEWDGTAWSAGPSGPSARAGHVMAFDPKRGVIVMSGGMATAASDETWLYDGVAWTNPAPASRPPARENAAMGWDPVSERMILFGGAPSLGDTWAWDGTTWTSIALLLPPRGRDRMAMATDPIRKNLVMYGGLLSDTLTNELWQWTGGTWVLHGWDLRPEVTQAMYALDGDRGRVVAFGGMSTSGAHGTTYELANDRWLLRPPGGAPPASRYDGGMAYDQKRREVVLFGGTAGTDVTDGTWVWTGDAWQRKTPAGATPSPRHGNRLVYVGATTEILMFGGLVAGLSNGETWTWNGVAWALRTTPPDLGARSGVALGYDPLRGVVVLFGGALTALLARGDMWEWSLGAWTKVTPAIMPGARSDASFAWDPARRALVLSVGRNGLQDTRDVWAWDGQVWTRAETSSPPIRVGATLVTDPAGAGVLVLGGGNPAPNPDGARLRWESALADDTCAGNSDLDHDELVGCADPDCWATCAPRCLPGMGAMCPMTEARCGNGTCDPRETCGSCPADCICAAVCGDLMCAGGETSTTCPGDCP